MALAEGLHQGALAEGKGEAALRHARSSLCRSHAVGEPCPLLPAPTVFICFHSALQYLEVRMQALACHSVLRQRRDGTCCSRKGVTYTPTQACYSSSSMWGK